MYIHGRYMCINRNDGGSMTIKMVMSNVMAYGSNIEMYERTKDLVRNKINQNTSVVAIKKLWWWEHYNREKKTSCSVRITIYCQRTIYSSNYISFLVISNCLLTQYFLITNQWKNTKQIISTLITSKYICVYIILYTYRYVKIYIYIFYISLYFLMDTKTCSF